LNGSRPSSRVGRSAGGSGSTSKTSDFAQMGRALPLILSVAGVFLVLIPTNPVFVGGAFLSALVSMRALYVLVLKSGNLRFTWLLGTGLLLGYGLGTFNTAAQMLAAGETVATVTSHEQGALCTALAVCLWVSATLYFVGSLVEAPVKLDLSRLQGYDQIFLWASMAVVAAAFLTGGIGYMGADASDVTHHESPIGAFAALLSPILPGFTVLLRDKTKLIRRPIYFWLLLGIEFAALLPQGRRVLIYSAVLLFIAFTLRGTRLTLASGKTILLLLLAATTLYFGNKFFYAMRYQRVLSGHRASMGLISNLQGATEILLSGDSRYNDAVQKNLRERTLVLGYFSDLLDASWHREPLWGRATIFDIRMAVPAVLDPNKADVYDFGMEETIVNPEFGLKPVDQANSILTTGLADFGLIGCFVYPLFISAILSVLFRLSARWLPTPVVVVFFFAMTSLVLQTEFTTATYVVACRNVAVVAAGFVLLGKLRNALWRPPQRHSTGSATPAVLIVVPTGTSFVPNSAKARNLSSAK
jgi:hypothetical protein